MISSDQDVEGAVATAGDLMLDFAKRTGVTPGAEPRRYLWTDAFAVCNFLGLARATHEPLYTDLALRLVDQVHHTLGRTRPGSPRTGWLSGLGEQEGAAHPTIGGLRIGKRQPERGPEETFDESREWDRDGQYFHYLTKWMHALDQAARVTGDQVFNLWARELAVVAHRSFCHGPPGQRRMVWKMSTDLTRPLVSSMGQHDALDGLITAVQLQATAADLGQGRAEPVMTGLIADFGAMIGGQSFETTDPLGLGGLLMDAARIAQLPWPQQAPDGDLLDLLLDSALQGLPLFIEGGDVQQPTFLRLAFRELGLSIGLHALGAMRGALERAGTATTRRRALIDMLAPYLPLATAIESFWRDPTHRGTPSWSEHRDINEAMLATSLAPDGFLVLSPATGAGSASPGT